MYKSYKEKYKKRKGVICPIMCLVILNCKFLKIQAQKYICRGLSVKYKRRIIFWLNNSNASYLFKNMEKHTSKSVH